MPRFAAGLAPALAALFAAALPAASAVLTAFAEAFNTDFTILSAARCWAFPAFIRLRNRRVPAVSFATRASRTNP
ncbi:hypothetical protein [Massilia sp. NR 4-1]|uniref:hypothetical protein n=1 Tax=Massilia sp. NR 4-1 TaxID=1678028 RepID=UPI00123717DE|nr:hypothetical protein [Massilia sp. NR 4-1]